MLYQSYGASLFTGLGLVNPFIAQIIVSLHPVDSNFGMLMFSLATAFS